MNAVLKKRIIDICNQKIQSKGANVSLSFLLFCKQKRQSIIIDGSSQLVDFNQSAWTLKNATKINLK